MTLTDRKRDDDPVFSCHASRKRRNLVLAIAVQVCLAGLTFFATGFAQTPTLKTTPEQDTSAASSNSVRGNAGSGSSTLMIRGNDSLVGTPVVGLDWEAAGRPHWKLETNSSDDLCLYAYGNSGEYLRAPFCIARTAGNMEFSGPATFSSRSAPVSGGAAGPTFSAHNDGENGSIGLLAQYFSAANGTGFDVGAEFIATFNPTSWQTGANGQPGPGDMAQWVVALSPNDQTHNWGANVVEFNIVNRGPDAGWHRDRGFQPVTGGLVMVPETSVFGDPGGGEGKNATYAYTAAHSANRNSEGVPAAFYNDYLCEPNSEVGGTGRCFYATGDISGMASRLPYGPFQVDGTWLHGFDTTTAKFSDGIALRMLAGQSLGFLTAPNGTAAKITANGAGINANLILQPAGNGLVQISGSAKVGTKLADATTLYMEGMAGATRQIVFDSAGRTVWAFGPLPGGPSVGDAHADLAVFRYGESGDYLGSPLSISRETGMVILSQGAQVTPELVTDALVVNGHVKFGGRGDRPTASLGHIDAGSSDSRGAITLDSGTDATVVTFAKKFEAPPFCVLTGSRTDDTKAITAIDSAQITISLSSNNRGETVYWHCLQ